MPETLAPVTCHEDLPHRYASVESFTAMEALRAHPDLSRRRYFNDMFTKAIGYGWGRTDAPGAKVPVHRGDALDFATAYTIHTSQGGVTHALREAYNMWHATGRIAT